MNAEVYIETLKIAGTLIVILKGVEVFSSRYL